MMAHPYQCILSYNNPSSLEPEWILFGASGSQLVTQSSTGAISVWSPPATEKSEVGIPRSSVMHDYLFDVTLQFLKSARKVIP
jgi:hypothetical protein